MLTQYHCIKAPVLEVAILMKCLTDRHDCLTIFIEKGPLISYRKLTKRHSFLNYYIFITFK